MSEDKDKQHTEDVLEETPDIILVLNSGSSSLKAGLFASSPRERTSPVNAL